LLVIAGSKKAELARGRRLSPGVQRHRSDSANSGVSGHSHSTRLAPTAMTDSWRPRLIGRRPFDGHRARLSAARMRCARGGPRGWARGSATAPYDEFIAAHDRAMVSVVDTKPRHRRRRSSKASPARDGEGIGDGLEVIEPKWGTPRFTSL